MQASLSKNSSDFTIRKRSATSVAIAVFFAILFFMEAAANNFVSLDSARSLNILFSTLMLVMASGVAVRYAMLNRIYVLTPLPWFYVACAAYFGFGPLAWYFADYTTVAYIDFASHAPINDIGVFQANLLSAAGVAIVSLTLGLLQFFFDWEGKAPHDYLEHLNGRAVAKMFWLSIALGASVKYLLVLPSSSGLVGFEIPNFISQLTLLLKVAIVLGYVASAKQVRTVKVPLNLLIATELITSLMSASKSEILFVVLMVIIGRHFAQRSMGQAILLGGAAVLLYATFLANFVLFVRSQYSVTGVSSVSSLADATKEYFNANESELGVGDGVQLWWARLVFSNYQVFGINQYDSGQAGHTLETAPWAFTPRFLFPDKPILNPGGELSDAMLSGSSEWVKTSMTYFAEGYWNKGPLGVIIVSFWAGFAFFVLTYLVFSEIAAGRMGIALAAVSAIQMGYSVESFFVSTFLGGFALALLYALLGHLIDRFNARSLDGRLGGRRNIRLALPLHSV